MNMIQMVIIKNHLPVKQMDFLIFTYPHYGVVLPIIAQSAFQKNESIYQLETNIWSTKIARLVNRQKTTMLATPVAFTIWNVTKVVLILVFIAVIVALFIKKKSIRNE
ncbi:hypothetical protein [Ethanoligenens harbinense]|uniref:Uncharacterized protein n=1 Tax=Ethanoligenens harbinense (strain DSM 18485 / JCM 12961 / CGMCC 1.5033 / YUAN-3) TaxID=663278 RepID=E6U3F0_ETHHY|nr:hypothetical protein [Ethanoligenens harbinense]ADU26442.1 hypothetical protein Ethha_0877 [Ethanoligenens harbinense YUAN-3]AVQ95566.1 hypothetical protein CXQ68_04550 [Ethanoligenens harbinense YUAN-3]AYF38230.1 hypothetical protein CXP51_04410 [Ethanoligenens harbinense]AYF40975.1 hypothetical protein CN246_04540 [Ethanoligenens harbinense]QCN91807.1 hypothetical protein DRA42_04555 [Ethanoligenens harbinense]